MTQIAADHFPGTGVLATKSSTLGASARSRDTRAGRKAEVWLTPMVLADLADLGNTHEHVRTFLETHGRGALTRRGRALQLDLPLHQRPLH